MAILQRTVLPLWSIKDEYIKNTVGYLYRCNATVKTSHKTQSDAYDLLIILLLCCHNFFSRCVIKALQNARNRFSSGEQNAKERRSVGANVLTVADWTGDSRTSLGTTS